MCVGGGGGGASDAGGGGRVTRRPIRPILRLPFNFPAIGWQLFKAT